jgi:hypothetical protein
MRRICESNSGDMCVKGFRNGDGKIPSRIPRDFVLQIDDNVLDHRNAPEKDVRPFQRGLSRTAPLLALTAVNVGGVLIDTALPGSIDICRPAAKRSLALAGR